MGSICAEALGYLISLIEHSVVHWDWEVDIAACQCAAWLLPALCWDKGHLMEVSVRALFAFYYDFGIDNEQRYCSQY